MFKSIFVINAPVSLVFSSLCFGFWSLKSLGWLGNGYSLFLLSGAGFQWNNPWQYLSLLLYPFMHSSLEHLMNNMMYILLLGPILEERYSCKTLIAMMLFTTLVVAFAFIAAKGSYIAGASALAFMMIILSSFTHFHLKRIPVSFVFIFALYLIREMLGFGASDSATRVSHIVGGLCGAAFGLYQIGQEKSSTSNQGYNHYQ